MNGKLHEQKISHDPHRDYIYLLLFIKKTTTKNVIIKALGVVTVFKNNLTFPLDPPEWIYIY